MAESDIQPNSASEIRPDFRKQKRVALMALAVLAATLGGISVLIDESPSADRVVTIAGALLALSLVLTWVYYDSVEHHYRIGILLGICIILVGGIGLPVYLFKTRGLRGFISLGLVLLFGCGLGLITCVSGYAVYYVWKMCVR
jgi:peptidoglycan/LPS O-acetylase OafA/YrhL